VCASGLKRVSATPDTAAQFPGLPTSEREQKRMFTLLIAVGALFLAVAISAAIDPWHASANDDGMPTVGGIAL
jgi:hypothetical protein